MIHSSIHVPISSCLLSTHFIYSCYLASKPSQLDGAPACLDDHPKWVAETWRLTAGGSHFHVTQAAVIYVMWYGWSMR